MKKQKWTALQILQWQQEHPSLFYRNPADANVFVKKPFGLSWTLNFANPRTWLLLAGLAVAGGMLALLF